VRHEEGGSSDPGYRIFLHRYQRRRFRRRWGHVFEEFEPPNPESAAAVRRAAFRARGCPRRLLLVDDGLPDRTIGSGFDRMWDAVVELSEADYAVSVWPAAGINDIVSELGLLGIETIFGPLETHLREPSVLYDVVVLSRPHNFERYEAIVRACQPQSVLIYDAEAVYHRRIECDAKLVVDGPHATGLADDAQKMRALETGLRARADFLTCVSPAEEAFFSATEGRAPVSLVRQTAERPAIRAFVAESDRRGTGAWVAALSRAQLTRSAAPSD